MCVADVLALEDPEEPDILENGKTYSFWHPQADYRHFYHTLEQNAEGLLKERLKDGKLTCQSPTLPEIQNYVRRELEGFDGSYKRFLNPHIYKVSVTERLRALKLELIKNYLGEL
jgi:nicotinate phosphoribosyltransferase